MTSFFQQRLSLERLLHQLQQGDRAEAYRTLMNAISQERADAAREISLILAAVVTDAGGRLVLSKELLALLPINSTPHVAFLGDHVAITVEDLTPELRAFVDAALANGATSVPAAVTPVLQTDYPPSVPAEDDAQARQRLGHAVKQLLQRHYAGELKQRGFEFLTTLWGELLAASLAVERQRDDAPPLEDDLQDLVKQLAPRVDHYARVVDAQADLAPIVEPGEPPAAGGPDSRRLH